MTRRQVLYILAGAALLAAAGALMLLRTPDTTDNVVLYPDAYSREYYLNLCGWQVTLLQEDTVTIPRQFNDTYRAYSQLQEKQGFPLSRHKGEQALRCTYQVENYGGDVPVRAELLLCGGVIVAGSIYTLEQPSVQIGLHGET